MEHSRDIQTFNCLYTTYKKRFVHYAKTYVEDRDVAEDLVMDSLVYYWENRLSLTHETNIPAYVLKVVKNKCLNFLRHERTRCEVEKRLSELENWELNLRIVTLEACNPEKIFSDEVHQIIHQTLEKLPEKSQEIFIRSKYENQSYKEIAEKLNLSVKSIEYHMAKTIKQLRKALKDYMSVLF